MAVNYLYGTRVLCTGYLQRLDQYRLSLKGFKYNFENSFKNSLKNSYNLMVITAKLIETSYIRDMYYNKDVKRADDFIIKRY